MSFILPPISQLSESDREDNDEDPTQKEATLKDFYALSLVQNLHVTWQGEHEAPCSCS